MTRLNFHSCLVSLFGKDEGKDGWVATGGMMPLATSLHLLFIFNAKRGEREEDPSKRMGKWLGMEEVEDQYRNQISCWHKELFSRLLMSC